MGDERERLLSTGQLARELGVDRTTVLRWWWAREITPAYVTPGGHGKWRLSHVMRQLQRRHGRE